MTGVYKQLIANGIQSFNKGLTMNLLEETIDIMEKHEKFYRNVDYINLTKIIYDEYGEMDTYDTRYNSTLQTGDWNDFITLSTMFEDYDNGYGGAEVPEIYIVFNDGSWLERFEYDGAECWEYKSIPQRINIIA